MSSSLFSPEWICNALSDLLSLHLTMTGCLVSVFTLLYSFIVSKKSDLKLYADLISRGDKSPTILQKQHFAAKHIKGLSKVSNICLMLLFCSIVFSFGSWIGGRLLEGKSQQLLLIILGFLTFIVFIIIGKLIVDLLKHYKDDIRI